ncbi:hypothetical protein [Enterococcus sp. AZ196]|uniref:phage scaffolding protein n=1 Tax=Enterococcus sp. AZ196 TaxID=2774659 RepID=UPI003D28D717
MNREQLRALGLNEEQIDAVVADHGRVVQAVQTRLTAAENRATELEGQLEQAANSEEVQQLTQRAEQAESRVTELEGQATQRTIDDLVNAALSEAGATDLEYARFKLGEVELSEDGKTVKDLENRVKDLQESIPNYFQAVDSNKETDEENLESNPNPMNNFQRINPKPGDGKQTDPDPTQQMIDAFTADLPQTANK